MFSTKSSIMLAFLALFLCASSTVQAAAQYTPENPLNCTVWTNNCRALGDSIYGGAKNASYTSVSATCAVNTTLTGAEDLCGYKVTCLATFMTMGGPSSNMMINAVSPSASAGSPSTGAPTAAPSASSTGPAGPKPTGPVYGVGFVNMTSQLLGMYDTSKCAKGSAAAAKMVTSAAAAAVVASILSIMSYAL